ncbi:hypothetical protein [Photobacterium phosphoreum]|jgi:hypothetical protein|uniref:hypothetical protein n=1 Tax=Photobacterium phosphoreum TaxID=659 RepID=UPI000A80D9D5|nr:hypothetical protein [Photobacterium phosphoreum]
MKKIIFTLANIYYLYLLGGIINTQNDFLLLSVLFITPVGLWNIMNFIEMKAIELLRK